MAERKVSDKQTVYHYVPDEVRRIHSLYPVLKYGRTDACFPAKTRFYSEDMEFCLRISSKAEFAEDMVNGKLYRTPFPHVMFKLPRLRHRSNCLETRHAFFFHYGPAAPAALLHEGFPVDELFWPLIWNDRLGEIIEEMMQHSGSLHSPGIPEQVDSLARQLLLECYLQRSLPAAADRREQAIRAVASYLQLHCTEAIDFDALIARHGLSRRSFFRHWAKFYREAPAEMVRNLRLRHAKELLLRTDLQIAEISARLNFQHTEYFIRAFKSDTGQTPRQYRKSPK